MKRLYRQFRSIGMPADQAYKLAKAALAMNLRGISLGNGLRT